MVPVSGGLRNTSEEASVGMRMIVAAAAGCILANPAGAGTLHCSFTEPFLTIDYDSATGKAIYLSPDEFDDDGKMVPKVMAESAKLVPEPGWQDDPVFYLMNGTEKLLTIKMTGRGSDGMSDARFPFEAWSGGREGGCETDTVHAWDPSEFRDGFGIPY